LSDTSVISARHPKLPAISLDTSKPATFFITTGYIDSRGEVWLDELERIVFAGHPPPNLNVEDWHLQLYRKLQPLSHWMRRKVLDQMLVDHRPTPARLSHRILNSEELASLASEPLVEVGAHTVTHPLLAARRADEQIAELRTSKQWLERFLGREIRCLSYPYGGSEHYTPETIRAASECGFEKAYTTNAKYWRHTDLPLALGRFQVPDVDGDQFEKFLWSIET